MSPATVLFSAEILADVIGFLAEGSSSLASSRKAGVPTVAAFVRGQKCGVLPETCLEFGPVVLSVPEWVLIKLSAEKW